MVYLERDLRIRCPARAPPGRLANQYPNSCRAATGFREQVTGNTAQIIQMFYLILQILTLHRALEDPVSFHLSRVLKGCCAMADVPDGPPADI